MSQFSRRRFLKRSAFAAGAAFTLGGPLSARRVLGAGDSIRVGVAGLNGRGGTHVGEFLGMEGVEISYLIDPDTRTFKGHADKIEKKTGRKPAMVQDVRKALEDKDLDVISIATTNHWHAPMTIWACQAGKDVYVEKPCSHNVREGRIAVECARKYNRIVQHGTQGRSERKWAKLAEIAKQGLLGKLLVSYGLCYKTRNSIGHKQATTPPPELDFNLWLGPAPDQPHHANLVHYNWHWFWDFGNGDIGNQGVHQFDVARWLIPSATWPASVISVGGRFGYEDQGQTPNTQVSVMDFGETKLVFEVRGLKTGGFHGETVGNIAVFEKGVVSGGDKFFPTGSTQAEKLPDVSAQRGPGGGIFRNFITAVRSRRIEDLDADILEAHYSAGLCHLPNISYRLGEEVPFRPITKSFGDDKVAADAFARMEEHLSGPNKLTLDGIRYRLGKMLKFDGAKEQFVDCPEANALLTRNYRAPFTIPDKVS
ncbi:MAG TPA: gfo/Idh/MocA family oxidoreductase [Planctomycetes bacterium]|nr:gfo/Idh/MocA family oxidoreductase [Planctomycetota bacterium]